MYTGQLWPQPASQIGLVIVCLDMAEASDDALLGALAGGDQLAATAFVRRHQQRVFGLAKVIVGDEDAAEELAQEAFLRAWQSAATYDPRRGSVLTWLLAITRNLAIDRLRGRRLRDAELDRLCAVMAASAPDPADAGAASADARAALAAVLALPPEQRRALFGAVFLGATAREISEAEGIPLGTAKSRVRLALRRLRTAVGVDTGARSER